MSVSTPILEHYKKVGYDREFFIVFTENMNEPCVYDNINEACDFVLDQIRLGFYSTIITNTHWYQGSRAMDELLSLWIR